MSPQWISYSMYVELSIVQAGNSTDAVSLQELETLSHADQQGIAHVWSLFSAAPSKHRNLMLQGIMTQCCFPQLSYIAANVRDLIRIDFITAPSGDLLQNPLLS
jgi:F-box/WD-40 domain protein MET30